MRYSWASEYERRKMEMQALILSILLLCILTGSDAKSIDQPPICAEKCIPGTRRLFENNGYEYAYSYKTIIESSFHTDSAPDQKAQLSIEVPFTIQANSDCDLVLQVERGIYIDDAPPRTPEEIDWQENLIQNPLHFSWQDGLIENVCPTTDEPVWALNFKRGLLSAMQITTMKNNSAVPEVDVSGECEANYFILNDGKTTIQKTKDYTKCINRDKHLSFSWSTPYEIRSPRQNYIHSMQTCKQTMTNVLEKVKCTEEHVFRPFSTDEAGARTSISQKIKFLRQRRISSSFTTRETTRKASLAYEEEPEKMVRNMEEASLSAQNLMTDICNDMESEDYHEVSKQFMSLVFAMRRLDLDSLSGLYSHIETCRDSKTQLRQMFDDSLPFCGTEGCVRFASSLILKNELENKIAERWLTGFSFVKEPTEQMISSILEIVESNRLPETSYLTLGNMIHQFCEISDENCMNNHQIRQTLEVLMQHLGANCRSSRPEAKKMILLALRAIGNAGQTTEPSVLRRCIAESQNSMEVRVAAVQAYRLMSCGSDRSVLLSTLRDENEDSELRIASYINLMQCPTSDLIVDVKNMIEVEQNMQVGSYIWSHLTQLTKSEDPLKHFVQILLTDHTFKEFSLDPRKYSRYYEASLFSEKLNSGGTVDASLIWSPKSFIPRSASVNLTVDLFGQAMNLFEFGGRVQGLESYLQSWLEPEAFAKRQEKKNLPSEKMKPKESALEEAQGSWFMRVVGKEVLYGNTDMMTPIEERKTSNAFIEFVSKFMSKEGYNYHDDSLLMNSINTIPTGTGMPLQIAFNGSTSVDMNAIGKFNMGFNANPEIFVRGKFSPRAAVVVSGSMSIDAQMRKTGIATESVAYTSTSVGGYVKVFNEGQSFEFELDVPYQKNTAFRFNHKLLRIEGNTMEELKTTDKFIRSNDISECTGEFLGQRLCYDKKYVSDRYPSGAAVNPIFPMDGELQISAYLEKTDSSLTKYVMSGTRDVTYEKEEDAVPTNVMISLNLDTPGSTVNRKTILLAEFSVPERMFSASAQQGENVLLLQGTQTSNEGSEEFIVSAQLNEDLYKFSANFEKTSDDEGKEWNARAALQLPDKTMSATANMAFNPGKRARASFVMDNVLPTPVILKIDLKDESKHKDKYSYSGEGKISVLPFINTEFMMDMQLKPKADNMKLNVNYKIGSGLKQSIFLHHKRTIIGRKSETDWKIFQMLTSSQFPSVNHKLSVSHRYVIGQTKSTIEAAYGPTMDESDNPYKIELRQEYNDNSNEVNTDINGQWSFNIPYFELNREFMFEHTHGKNNHYTKVKSIHADEEPVQYSFLWKNNAPESSLINTNMEAEFPTPWGDMQYKDSIKESEENVYELKSTLSLGEATELQFNQNTKFVWKEATKSFELTVEKGNGLKIFTVSSINTLTSEYMYSSKNFLDVSGYVSRGLNVSHEHQPARGYPTTIKFLKSGTVHVGITAKYMTTENGKHIALTINQDNVKQHTVSAKAGYEYQGDSIKLFSTLSENDEVLFNANMAVEYLTKSGKFAFNFQEHLSEKKLDINATLSYLISDNIRTSVYYRQADKSMIFEVNTAENGVDGILRHNFCDYMNEVSYNVGLTSNGCIVSITSSGSQARVVVTKLPKKLEVAWNHDRIPEFVDLKVPTRAKWTLSATEEGTTNTVSTTLNVDREVVFSISFEWPDRSTFGEITMSNSILKMLPKSAKLTYEVDEESLKFQVAIDSETMEVALKRNSPSIKSDIRRHSSIEFSRTANLMSCEYIPKNFKFGFDYLPEERTLKINFELDDKSADAEFLYSSASSMKASMNSEGIKTLPKQASIELKNQFEESPYTIEVTLTCNEDTYLAKMELLNDMKVIENSNWPYLPYLGTQGLTVEMTKNKKSMISITLTNTITETKIIQLFKFTQDISKEFIPSMERKQVITCSKKEHSYFLREEVAGSDPMELELKWTRGSLVFRYTGGSPSIPTYISAKKEYAKTTLTIEKDGKTRTGFYSFNVDDDNRLHISSQHNFDEIAEYVPKTLAASVNFNEGEATYTWGKETGGMKVWKDTWAKGGAYLKFHIKNINFNFTYSTTDTSFDIHAYLTFADQEYSADIDGGLNEDDSVYYYNEHMKANDKYANSMFRLKFDKNHVSYNSSSEQTLCKGTKDVTLNFVYGAKDKNLGAEVTLKLDEKKYTTSFGAGVVEGETQKRYFEFDVTADKQYAYTSVWCECNGKNDASINFKAEQTFSDDMMKTIIFNFTYALSETRMESRAVLSLDGTEYSAAFCEGYEMGDSPVFGVKKVYFEGDVFFDDKYATTRNWVDINMQYMFINVSCEQTFTDKVDKNFHYQRNITWGFFENGMNFRIEGVETDPFLFAIDMSYEGMSSFALEMRHKQKEWENVPQQLTISGEKQTAEGSFNTKLTVKTESWTKSLTGNVKYDWQSNDFFLDGKKRSLHIVFDHDFAIVPGPRHFELHYEDSKNIATFRVVYDDMHYDEEMRVTNWDINEDFEASFSFNQNMMSFIPSKFSVTVTKTSSSVKTQVISDANQATTTFSWSEREVALAFEISTEELLTPAQVELKWTKSQRSPIGDLSFTHNFDQLSFIPRSVKVRLEPNKDMSKVRFIIDADEYRRKALISQTSNDDSREVKFEHNFDLLAEYNLPKEVSIRYQKAPFTLTANWDENEVSIEKSDGLKMTQNVFDELPQFIHMKYNYDLLQMELTVDDFTYYMKYNLDMEETLKTNFECKITQAEKSLLHVTVDTNLSLSSGYLKFYMSQSLNDKLPEALSHNVEFEIGESSGTISVLHTVKEPIAVKVKFAKESDGYTVGVTHNIEHIRESLPFETTGTLTTDMTPNKKTVNVLVKSSEWRKSFTFEIVTNIEEESKDLLMTMTHNFDLLEDELFIPKSVEWHFVFNPSMLDVQVTYNLQSTEKQAKLQTSIGDSLITITFEQNIIISTSRRNGRRNDLDFPTKITIELINESDSYKSRISFKSGQKRRYVNMEYTAKPTDEGRQWSFGISQNLNKLMPVKLPTLLNVDVTSNENDVGVKVMHNENEYLLTAWKGDKPMPKVGFRFTHDNHDLAADGVPHEISSEMKIDKSAYVQVSFNIKNVGSGDVTMTKTDGRLQVKVNMSDSTRTLSSTLAASEVDSGYSLTLTGTQTGMDDKLPRDFNINAVATYKEVSSNLTLTLTHNIPALKSAGIPYYSIVSGLIQKYSAESGLTFGFLVRMDDLAYSENFINLNADFNDNGYEITASGLRTPGIWSTSPPEPIVYEIKSSSQVTETSNAKQLNWVFTWRDADEEGNLLRNYKITYEVKLIKNSATWVITSNVPFTEMLNEPITITGTASQNDNSYSMQYNVTKGENKYHGEGSVMMNGESFEYHCSCNEMRLDLVYNPENEQQFVFTNTLKCAYGEFLPKKVVVSYDEEQKLVAVNIETGTMETVMTIKPSYFKLSTTTPDNGEIVGISTEYIDHPSYKVTAEFKVVPFEIDYSASFEAQFMTHEEGKSTIDISLIDNFSEKYFKTSGHAFLQNSNIFDLNLAFNIDTTMTDIPLTFVAEYVLQTEPQNMNLKLQMREYSISMAFQKDFVRILVTLPETFKIYKVLYEEKLVDAGNGRKRGTTSLTWNDHESISYSILHKFEPESHLFTIDIHQPFVEPKTVAGSYRFNKVGKWYYVNVAVNDVVVSTKYSDEAERTCKLVVDIQQPFDHDYIPKQFTTTGTITWGELLYNSDWKITTDGEDIVILKKVFTQTTDGYHMSLNWKQPYEDLFLGSLDSTLDIINSPNSLEVINEVTHSLDNKYIPKQYTVTGTITQSDTSCESNWKVVGEGKQLLVYKSSYKETNEGYQTSVSFRQPYKEFGLTEFDVVCDLKLGSNHMHLVVDITQPFDNKYVPKHFVTTGVIIFTQGTYDSDWKITSGGEDMVIFKKYFKADENGYSMNMHLKQPFEEFGLTSLDAELNYNPDSAAGGLTSEMQYNDAHEYAARYTWEKQSENSKNTTLSVTVDDDTYENKWYCEYVVGKKSGTKLTVVIDMTMPEKNIFSPYLPSTQHLTITVFCKNANFHFKVFYEQSLIKNPIQLEGMYVLHNGNKLFDSSLTYKNAPVTNSRPDAEFKLAVDTIEGFIVSGKVPAIGFDQTVTIKYDQTSKVITFSYDVAGKKPITITIKLNEILPHLKAIAKALKDKDFIPKIKVIGDYTPTNKGFDMYLGVQINSKPYTIHAISEYVAKRYNLKVVTKRGEQELDTLLQVTAFMSDTKTVQIEIESNKQLSRVLNFASTSSHNEMKDKIMLLSDSLINMLESLGTLVEGSERVQSAINEKKDIAIEFIKKLRDDSIDVIDNANSLTSGTLLNTENAFGNGLSTLVKMLSTAVEKVRNFVSKPLQEIKQDYLERISTEVYNNLRTVLEPLAVRLNQVHAGQLFLELLQEGVTKFIFWTEKNMEAILNAAQEPLAKLVSVGENKVIITVPLHVEVKGFIAPPSVKDIAMWIAQSSLAHEYNEKIKIFYKIIDLYYQYRSILNMPWDEIVPPFKGHAELVNFQHFHTFDGTRFDYMSKCDSKHVLAHDVVNNEFEVFVTYGSSPTITISTYDSTGRASSIVMKQDYTIVDESGRDVLLPADYADVSVRRTGEFVTVKTIYGLAVSCNFVSNFCAIDVSPFYFASVGGMLGDFNNEPHDDFMGPRQTKVRDFEQLAQAWMMSTSCSGENKMRMCSSTASDMCIELFENSNSKFSSCFAVVDPAPYKRMCLLDSCASSVPGICSASAAYARRCALRGVDLQTPQSCMRCMAASGERFSASNNMRVSGADVVFVIEKSGCLRFRKKDFKRLIGGLHSSLNDTLGSGNLKYAVVGFGGPNGEPHTVPFGNEIFMQTNRIMSDSDENMLRSALMRGEKSNTESDILSAIHYASQLPFRAGAARTIILLTCDDCSGDSVLEKSDVQRSLQEQGIVLHHLRQKTIQAGGAAKKVYGFNHEEIFSKGSSEQVGRSELKGTGNDQCLPLIDVTGGSIWNSNMFGRESLQSIVVEVSRGVNSASRQECVCSISDNGSATSKCIMS